MVLKDMGQISQDQNTATRGNRAYNSWDVLYHISPFTYMV